jgi:hypothetical protein
MPHEIGERLPCLVDVEVHRDLLDRLVRVGQAEVVIERVDIAPLHEDARERVGDQVVELGIGELRVGRQAAAPAKPRPLREGVVVDRAQVASGEIPRLTGRRIDALQALEPQELSGGHAEDALPAVPVAGEHHRVALDDVKGAVGVETRGDVEGAPVQRPLRQRRPGRAQHEDQRRDQRTHAHGL